MTCDVAPTADGGGEALEDVEFVDLIERLATSERFETFWDASQKWLRV